MQDTPKTQLTKVEETKPAEIVDGQLILTNKHKELIKNQIAPTATKEELDLFFMMAYRTKLDPLLKQLYFIKYGKGDRANVSYVTSIDGYRIIAHRTGQFAGIDEPNYKHTKKGILWSCTITVYRKDSDRGFSATVHFKEYNTGKNLWSKMPMTMIAKVAEAHALRKAFPHDLSGIYTTDEMDQADKNRTPKPPKLATKAQIEEIEELLEQKDKSETGILKYFKVKTFKQLNEAQANKAITQLSKMPDPEKFEVVDSVDEINVDEIDEGIEEEKVKKEPKKDKIAEAQERAKKNAEKLAKTENSDLESDVKEVLG